MGVVFEVYAPDGTLQLNTETKPIGRSITAHDWDPIKSSDYREYFINPKTKERVGVRDGPTYSYLRFSVQDGHMYFLQLNDGAMVCMSPNTGGSFGFTENPGKLVFVDMREFIPTPKEFEHLQVFNTKGQMVWGSESLASSVQLIEWKEISIEGKTYRTVPQLFFDIPDGVDPNKVFFFPVMPAAQAMPNEAAPGAPQTYHLIYFYRRGNRVYMLPDYYMSIYPYEARLTENMDAQVSDAVGGTTLQILVMYIPNPP
ncbi:hypothetical protein OHW66_14335 [Acinetobacter baumannii]|nr:hypothetical protein [Acinetobacter baumannii]